MTEADWLSSVEPAKMLAAMHTPGDPVTDLMDRPVSDRKLRLFACACCRAVWDGAVCQDCKGTGVADGWDCETCGIKGLVGGRAYQASALISHPKRRSEAGANG